LVCGDNLPRPGPLPKEREKHSSRLLNVVRLDWRDGYPQYQNQPMAISSPGGEDKR
jgi:hypothetical protein